MSDLALYIHWPFCKAKCPYCDFNSHVRDSVDQARWGAALAAEIGHYAAQTPGRTLTSIFFGGGTPSLMTPATVGAVLAATARHWAFDPGIEITLEANPTSAEADNFRGYRTAGVNRVSLGVQALNDADLAALGRWHSAAEARAAVGMAQSVFDRVSFDLIYARPGQTAAGWRAELSEALTMAAGHLSLYQLTIEQGTAFYTRHQAGDLIVPGEDDATLLYEVTQEMCAAAGLPAYEISNHAAPGQESRHNLTYWRYGEYAGVGPGAHGRVNGAATRQIRSPEKWLAAVNAAGHATEAADPLTPADRAAEALMMGLRLTEGIDRARFHAAIGAPVDNFIDAARLADLTAQGFIETTATTLRATPQGLPLVNAILRDLLV